MGGTKTDHSFELNPDQVEWLKEMAEKHSLPDEHKALRVLLDYAKVEADQEQVFTEFRCLHC